MALDFNTFHEIVSVYSKLFIIIIFSILIQVIWKLILIIYNYFYLNKKMHLLLKNPINKKELIENGFGNEMIARPIKKKILSKIKYINISYLEDFFSEVIRSFHWYKSKCFYTLGIVLFLISFDVMFIASDFLKCCGASGNYSLSFIWYYFGVNSLRFVFVWLCIASLLLSFVSIYLLSYTIGLYTILAENLKGVVPAARQNEN